jgi:hypothetical protein
VREDTVHTITEKSVRQFDREIGISKSSAHWDLKTAKWKCYMPE